MPGLFVIAHKTPVRPVRAGSGWRIERGEGGLVSALTPAITQRRGLWFGNDASAPEGWRAITPRLGFRVKPVPISADYHDQYYNGFCNGTIWPLFHDFLGASRFDTAWWQAYIKANQSYADEILACPEDADVWVQDYHFMLLPQMLRERGEKRKIRFFLHIPFPAFAIFRHLPWRIEILRGLAAADEIGFHTTLYRDNFLSTVAALLGPQWVCGQHIVDPATHESCAARAMPISVDTAALAAAGEHSAVLRRAAELHPPHRAVILGVDRLDYTKGLKERFLALELFIERTPESLGAFSMIQVAVPSRGGVDAYSRHKREVEELIGRINGRFSSADWTPIRYLHRHLGAAEIHALYKAADVVMVTPLCDGMNLVAKEYVAVKAGGAGVLILSEFAGAAQELAGALLVNPHHLEAVASTLQTALAMPPIESRRRMASMYRYLLAHDVYAWVNDALGSPQRAATQAS